MRILVISNYYPPLSVGGYEIACAQTVEWLRARGHQVRVMTSKWRAAEAPAAPDLLRVFDMIDYKNGGYQQKWQTERWNYLQTLQQLISWKPDLVYIWSQRLISLGPVYAVQRLDLPRVFEIGDFWPDSYIKPGWQPRLKREIKRLIPGLMGDPLQLDPVISVARWMVPELRSKYGSQRVQVVPNGLPLPAQTGGPDWSKPLKALFVGRLDPEKGLHLAIEALARLRDGGLILPLTVAGKGDKDYTDQCRQLVFTLGLQDQVKFIGWQPDTARLYAQHQILLMPTTMREPFGMVLVEAMMHGLAVFASGAFGPAEIIKDGETGFLFQPGSISALASRLHEQMLQPLNLTNVGQRGATYARQHYAIDTVKARVEHILYDVAGGHKWKAA